MDDGDKKIPKPQGFQCKQFFVAHDQCAMKVGTDSLILGSWCEVSRATRVLDIGCGSGVLSLMLAQKSKVSAKVIGIDIDQLAVDQAKSNGSNTEWRDKLEFFHIDVNRIISPLKYDCIISVSIEMTSSRRQARQTSSLSFQQLLKAVMTLLSDNGSFYLIIPHKTVPQVELLANSMGLFCHKRLMVRSKGQTPFIRQCLCLSHTVVEDAQGSTLTIYDGSGRYTEDYRMLCQDFYLAF